MKLVKRM